MQRNGKSKRNANSTKQRRSGLAALFILVVIFTFTFVSLPAWAGIVTGELDKAEGTLEDQFIYTLAVQGSIDGDPEFPKIDGLDIQRSGTNQSMSMINGHFSRETQYQFVIMPSREGTFALPPIKVKVDGEWQQTLPLEIKVKADQSSSAIAEKSNQSIFIDRVFSKNKLYVGESIVARLRVFVRVKMFGASPDIKYPPSFQARAIEEQKTYSQTIDGEEFSVTELLTVLTPQKDGTFKIDPAILNAKIAGERRRRAHSMIDEWMNPTEIVQKKLRSSEATIEVLPIPLAGRRRDFTGLVGEYKLDADVGPRELKVGETATLTLTISGNGSTNGMADPSLDFGDRAKVYKDKPQSLDAVDSDSGVRGQRILKFAIVPTKSGDLDLGQLSLQYFNTQLGQYQDLVASLGTLHVTGEAQSQQLAPSNPQISTPQAPQEVATLGEDLLELHAPARLATQEVPSPLEWTAGGVGSFASLGFLLFSFWRKQRDEHAPERLARRRASEAWNKLRLYLDEAEHDLQESTARVVLSRSQQRWKAYFSDKFGIKAGSLTIGELESRLAPFISDPQALSSIRSLWAAYEKLLFGANEPSAASVRELLNDSKRLMQEVDKRC